jgi:hypothetical protein
VQAAEHEDQESRAIAEDAGALRALGFPGRDDEDEDFLT